MPVHVTSIVGQLVNGGEMHLKFLYMDSGARTGCEDRARAPGVSLVAFGSCVCRRRR